MAPSVTRFGFAAEYMGESPAYEEFEKFLRLEFDKTAPEWDPSFGRVVRFDPHAPGWQYSFLLKGNVPKAASHAEAERKVRALTQDLARGLKRAHANPGASLPEPVIRVWEWALATTA